MQPFWTSVDGFERSGMGFTVMESFMDSIDVASKVGSGTTVRLYKQLESGRPAAKEACSRMYTSAFARRSGATPPRWRSWCATTTRWCTMW